VTLPWNPSRRALNRTSVMVRPEPISTIDIARQDFERCKRAIAGGGLEPIGRGQQHDVGGDRLGSVEMNTVAAALSATSRGHGVDELELHIRPRLDRLKETLPHIFAKELPRQKRVAETVMQAGMGSHPGRAGEKPS
jgi:hypothetical protein